MPGRQICVLIALLSVMGSALAEPRVFVDDTGHEVTLDAPAERIVSLAPSVTENLFAAGAGGRVVAVVEHSDYPPAARRIPRVGSAQRLDVEGIVGREPDLVIGWASGNPSSSVDRLRELGIPVYMMEAREPLDIARNLEQMGMMSGNQSTAQAAAKEFRERYSNLRTEYEGRDRVSIFYQIWNEPLMTVNGDHLISALIRDCGGENVFSDLRSLAPRIDVEAVLVRDPDGIIASGSDDGAPEWLDEWGRWSQLAAIRGDNVYSIPPDLIQRQTPRILAAMAQLCEHIESTRATRP